MTATGQGEGKHDAARAKPASRRSEAATRPDPAAMPVSGEDASAPCAAPGLAEMEAVFDNVPIGLLLVRNGRIRRANARGAALLGYAPEALVGRDGALLFPSPQDCEAFRRQAEQDLSSSHGVWRGECRLLRQDGGRIDVRFQAKTIGGGYPQGDVIWSFEDVTEQKNLEETLRAAKQAANTAKMRFLANMSQELRTPLTSIVQLAQKLLDGPVAGETREHLDTIRESADILQHIVGELLELSTVESGKLALTRTEFHLEDELLPLLRDFDSQSRLRAFDFTFSFDPRLPSRLVGDPQRLRQILTTLLGNAFKYTEGGAVSLRIAPAEAAPAADAGEPSTRVHLVVTVTDTGPGLAPDRLEGLFERPGTGEDACGRLGDGADVDLPTARRLARLMDGDLSVECAPGGGSAFRLTLACEPAAPKAAPVPAAPVKPVGAVRKTGLRILLAEDEPVNRIFTVRALQKLGHQVETAVDGREALSLLGRGPFDLILMDIQMPRLNGLEATRLIRSGQVSEGVAAIPVVALTAYAMDADRERGLAAGMDEYVTKPFEPHELAAAMERAMAKQDG
jgi:PAS domain S-box-containing protein